MSAIRLEAHTGVALARHLDTRAALRIRVLRGVPRLYAGDADHPRRRDDLRAAMAWQDPDDTEETDKPMVFWLQPLTPGAAS